MGKVFSVIDMLSARGSEKEVLELALKEGVTVYDASYIYVAASRNFVLVTDDAKLRERSRKYVDVLRRRDVLERG